MLIPPLHFSLVPFSQYVFQLVASLPALEFLLSKSTDSLIVFSTSASFSCFAIATYLDNMNEFWGMLNLALWHHCFPFSTYHFCFTVTRFVSSLINIELAGCRSHSFPTVSLWQLLMTAPSGFTSPGPNTISRLARLYYPFLVESMLFLLICFLKHFIQLCSGFS